MWAPGQECFRSFRIAVLEVWEANRMNWKTKPSCLSSIQYALKGFALKLLEDARLAAASRWRA